MGWGSHPDLALSFSRICSVRMPRVFPSTVCASCECLLGWNHPECDQRLPHWIPQRALFHAVGSKVMFHPYPAQSWKASKVLEHPPGRARVGGGLKEGKAWL